jgi:probable phosphoglycerate mutase
MTRLILVRHAEAEGNVRRIFHGHTNGDITENGEVQLERLAERCKSLHYDIIYSSDLQRCIKTANAVNRYHHLPVMVDDRFREIYGGRWEGVPFAELPVKFPVDFGHWNDMPHLLNIPEGESMVNFRERVVSAAGGICLQNDGKTVCLVTHGTVIRILLCEAKGLPLCGVIGVNWCDNTAISILGIEKPFRGKVLLENDNSHLTGGLSTLEKQTWWRDGEE